MNDSLKLLLLVRSLIRVRVLLTPVPYKHFTERESVGLDRLTEKSLVLVESGCECIVGSVEFRIDSIADSLNDQCHRTEFDRVQVYTYGRWTPSKGSVLNVVGQRL
jgi:hypothetical protein